MKKNKLNANLVKIVSLLSDGEYHDGDSIGAKIGITRSAVWKALEKLRSYGVAIDSVKGSGYKLQEPLRLLNKKYIVANAKASKFKLDIFETIGSTNEHLRSLLIEKSPRFCLAEQQTQGRGRLGRSWYSPFAKNIYLSCRYLFEKDIGGLVGLSLVVGLSVIAALKKYLPAASLKAKWPNDIVFEGKKLAGILIDIQAEANGFCSAIIGVGLNVNMLADKTHQISQGWTSMGKILNCYFDRNLVCVSLIDALLEYLEKFAATGWSGFTKEWQQIDYLYNHNITIKTVAGKMMGKAKGVDRAGQLLLELSELSNGKVQAFSAGDVSIE